MALSPELAAVGRAFQGIGINTSCGLPHRVCPLRTPVVHAANVAQPREASLVEVLCKQVWGASALEDVCIRHLVQLTT